MSIYISISQFGQFYRMGQLCPFVSSLLLKFVDNMELRLKSFENCRIMRNTLELSDVTGGGASLFLYQSGYLTIKDSDEFGYILDFPNEEVKQGLLDWKRVE